jgi:hypothetical protein
MRPHSQRSRGRRNRPPKIGHERETNGDGHRVRKSTSAQFKAPRLDMTFENPHDCPVLVLLCCRRKGNDVSAKRIQLSAAIGASIF